MLTMKRQKALWDFKEKHEKALDDLKNEFMNKLVDWMKETSKKIKQLEPVDENTNIEDVDYDFYMFIVAIMSMRNFSTNYFGLIEGEGIMAEIISDFSQKMGRTITQYQSSNKDNYTSELINALFKLDPNKKSDNDDTLPPEAA